MNIVDLSKPFRGTQISWRVGATTTDKNKGLPLAYIDARDVMDRLDEVCGPANWQAKYSHAEKRVICEISILIDGHWVTKANGAGDTDVEADKGAISDAFKRAAVLWGIGRYLYGLKAGWVDLEKKGRTHVIAEHEHGKLIQLHERFVGSSARPNNTAAKPPPKRRSKADSDDDYKIIQQGIDDAATMQALGTFWQSKWPIIQTMHIDYQDMITQRKDDKKHDLNKQAA